MSENRPYYCFDGLGNTIYVEEWWPGCYTNQLINEADNVGGYVLVGYAVSRGYGAVSSTTAAGKTVTSQGAYTSCKFDTGAQIRDITFQTGGNMEIHAGDVTSLNIEAGATVTVFPSMTHTEHFHPWTSNFKGDNVKTESQVILNPRVNGVTCYGTFVLAVGAGRAGSVSEQTTVVSNIRAIGANAEIIVNSNAVLGQGSVQDYAHMDIRGGATVNGAAAANHAVIDVAQDAEVTDIAISDNAVINIQGVADGSINAGGSAIVTGKGDFEGTIKNGGEIYVSEGGVIGKVKEPGVATSVDKKLTIDGGRAEVGNRGVVGNIDINGGTLAVTKGAKLQGNIVIGAAEKGQLVLGEDGVEDSFYGGTITIDMTNVNTNDVYAIKQIGNYTDGQVSVSVAGSLGAGTYILATGNGLDYLKYDILVDDISLKEKLSTIILEDTKVRDKREYTLYNQGGNFVLEVAEAKAREQLLLTKGQTLRYQNNLFLHAGDNTAWIEYCDSTGIYGLTNSGLAASSYKLGVRASVVLGGVASDFKLLDADMEILSGGVASDTVLSSGSVYVSGGAVMRGASMYENYANKIQVAQNGYLVDAEVHAGSIYIAQGGLASSVELFRDCQLTAQGVCSDVKVSKGGIARAEVGFGVLSSVCLVDGANLQNLQYYGGTQDSAYVERVSGDTFHGLVDNLQYTGSAQLGAEAQARQLVLGKGAQLSAFDGAQIAAGTICEGGVMTLSREAAAEDLTVSGGASVILVSSASVTNAKLEDGAVMSACATAVAKDITVSAGASLSVVGYDAELTGKIELLSAGDRFGCLTADGDILVSDAVISIDLAGRSITNTVAQISNLSALSDAVLTVNIAKNQAEGSYLLGTQGVDFDGVITIMSGANEIGDLTVADELIVDGLVCSISTDSFGRSFLNIDVTPDANLLDENTSQIIAWDNVNGSVGYIAAGDGQAEWNSVYGWSDAEAAMWSVEGIGRFKGSEVGTDGILIYNNQTNTYAAWTDLSASENGYVTLRRMDGACQTVGLADINGNEYDDVLVSKDDGSFGVLIDGTDWQSVSVDGTLELIGAGDFNAADGRDSLLVKDAAANTYSLLHNTDGAWVKTEIGAADWAVAGIGDFQNDGIDDIVLWNEASGEVVVWEDGDSTNVRNAGMLDPNFWEIAAVGDYDGDGKDDLLLREQVTGQGNLAYWGAGSDANMADLNTQLDNKFAVIA